MFLDSLSDDVLSSVLCGLGLEDLLRLSRVNLRLHRLINSATADAAWMRLYHEAFRGDDPAQHEAAASGLPGSSGSNSCGSKRAAAQQAQPQAAHVSQHPTTKRKRVIDYRTGHHPAGEPLTADHGSPTGMASDPSMVHSTRSSTPQTHTGIALGQTPSQEDGLHSVHSTHSLGGVAQRATCPTPVHAQGAEHEKGQLGAGQAQQAWQQAQQREDAEEGSQMDSRHSSWKERFRDRFLRQQHQERLRRRARVMKLQSSVQLLSLEHYRAKQALGRELRRLEAVQREVAAVREERRAEAVGRALSRQYWLPQAVQRPQGVVTSQSAVDLDSRELAAGQALAESQLEVQKLRNRVHQIGGRLEEAERKLQVLQP